jgi:hypothetical protein
MYLSLYRKSVQQTLHIHKQKIPYISTSLILPKSSSRSHELPATTFLSDRPPKQVSERKPMRKDPLQARRLIEQKAMQRASSGTRPRQPHHCLASISNFFPQRLATQSADSHNVTRVEEVCQNLVRGPDRSPSCHICRRGMPDLVSRSNHPSIMHTTRVEEVCRNLVRCSNRLEIAI